MSRILCISRHSPYQQSLASEALDTVLAAGAFEQDIALLLMDEGVWQLTREQQGSLVSRKTFSKKLAALPLFGIDNIFVHQPSLTARGLTGDELCTDAVQLLNNNETKQLIESHDQLLSF